MKQTDISLFDNSSYDPGKGKIVRAIWYFCNVIFLINKLNPLVGIKKLILKVFGAKIGKGVMIKPGVNIKYPWNVQIGDYSWIGEDVWIDSLGKVTIGSNVCISQGAYIATGNHDYRSVSFDLITADVMLEDGVWIGAFSVVCPGVRCRSHSMLTVNSVAVSDLEEYSIYQGNPATLKRKRVFR